MTINRLRDLNGDGREPGDDWPAELKFALVLSVIAHFASAGPEGAAAALQWASGQLRAITQPRPLDLVAVAEAFAQDIARGTVNGGE